jgi:ribosomal protein L9
MRNHLYPSKLALYVVNGRAVQLDGSYGPLRTANESASSSSSSQDISSSITSSSAPVVEESRILQQLEKLGPLRFERRTTGQDMLHGSVTQQNVLTALQEAGVQIQEMNGDWAATAQADALDHGKIKQLGEYICKSGSSIHVRSLVYHTDYSYSSSVNLQLKNTSKPIIVHVVNEASSEA